jgi:CheY-like chemotaxis protein
MEPEEVRVMVVDDMVDSAETLAAVLELNGYTVRAVTSGEAALQLVEQFCPLCILIDIQMPGLNGHDLTRQLRSRYGGDLVLVAVTGAGCPDDRLSSDFAHFDHYLRKPVDLELLEKLLPVVGDRTGT